jgi:hypothetical protein
MIMQVSGVITGNVIALSASFLRANGGQHVFEVPNASLAARFQLYSRGLLPKNFGLKGSIFATPPYADQKAECAFAAWRWLQI